MYNTNISLTDFDKMNFDEVRLALRVIYREYQKLQDEFALMKRHYENEFDNLNTYVDTSSNVNKVIEEKNEQSNEKTSVKVTADGIDTEVSETYYNAEVLNPFDEDKAREDTVYYESSKKLYHYYDAFKGIWVATDSDTFATTFEQTPMGFKLGGNAKISDNLYLGDFEETQEKNVVFNGAGKIYSFDGGYGYYNGIGISALQFKMDMSAKAIYLKKENSSELISLKNYINSSEVVARFA